VEFLALAASLDLTPAVAPTPVGCSDASVVVLPVPLLTTFSSQSDLVKVTLVDTPMPFSPNHRIFRCLGLAGPLVLFPLNSSAGPTRQLHTFFLLSREPPPLTHQTAAARAQLRRRMHSHRRRASPVSTSRLRRARSAPEPPARRPLRACTARSRCPPSARHHAQHSHSLALLPFLFTYAQLPLSRHARTRFQDSFFVLPFFRFEGTQGVRGFAS